jgi:hypothetical protein
VETGSDAGPNLQKQPFYWQFSMFEDPADRNADTLKHGHQTQDSGISDMAF